MNIQEVAAWISVIFAFGKVVRKVWKLIRKPVKQYVAGTLGSLESALGSFTAVLHRWKKFVESDDSKTDASNRKGVTGGGIFDFTFVSREAPVLLRYAEQFLFIS